MSETNNTIKLKENQYKHLTKEDRTNFYLSNSLTLSNKNSILSTIFSV